MHRIAVFTYGVLSYVVFLGTFLYAAGFIGNIMVPKSIDSGSQTAVGAAVLINAALLAGFAVQHSVMARGWFKRAWTRIIPREAERSTYVLMSSIMLILLFRYWQPVGGVVWDVKTPEARIAMQALCASGWLLVLASTFFINHFDLFGLRQVWIHLRGETYTPLRFRVPGLYRWVRHPLYLGWLIAFWATPTMTAAHLLFAGLTTAYIFAAIRWEERDLMRAHGADYVRYRETTPMILPLRGRAAAGTEAAGDAPAA